MRSTTSIHFITHSTAIEGSTLTELDTQLLFDEGVTAKGKPLVHHLMNEDLKKAYELAKEEAKRNALVTPLFLQGLNAALMRTTGSVHSVMGGSFDSSQGEYRLCSVTTGTGSRSYMNYQKVPAKVEELCTILQEKQKNSRNLSRTIRIEFQCPSQFGYYSSVGGWQRKSGPPVDELYPVHLPPFPD